MIVHVRSFASFRDILGKELSVELKEGSTVKDLLDDLISTRQRLKSAVFDESGKVREYVILMKNRKNIESLGGLDTELAEGDEVALLPPVAGG
ncbi:Small archaeal modifier protein 3 [uncultured archaeon]|nr:Small archaeal modifier protein 3 [uncultured archaeon]